MMKAHKKKNRSSDRFIKLFGKNIPLFRGKIKKNFLESAIVNFISLDNLLAQTIV